MQQFFTQMLPSAVVAAVAAGAVFYALGRLECRNRVAAPVAIAVGYMIGHAMAGGIPRWPVIDATHWPFYFAGFVAVCAVVETKFTVPRLLRAVLWAVICVGFLALLLKPMFQFQWKVAEGARWVAGFMVGTLLLTAAMSQNCKSRGAAIALPLFCSMVAGGTCGALMLSGSLLLGQYGAVLAAVSFAIGVIGFIAPARHSLHGGPATFAILFVSLWLSGYYYAELPATSALLLGAALLFCLPARFQSFRFIAVQGIGIAVAVGAAVYVAYNASPPMGY